MANRHCRILIRSRSVLTGLGQLQVTSFFEVFVAQKRRLCCLPTYAQPPSFCLLLTQGIFYLVLLLAGFCLFVRCFRIDLTGKPPISFYDGFHSFASRLRRCLKRSLYSFRIAESVSLLDCLHFVLFTGCNRNAACQVDRARSFGQTLENLWSQMQILFKCYLYSSYAMRKMELYFYIVSPKRARHILYCERGTSPSFEVLAYPVLHIRFFDH